MSGFNHEMMRKHRGKKSGKNADVELESIGGSTPLKINNLRTQESKKRTKCRLDESIQI
jgi:hypothetical protein